MLEATDGYRSAIVGDVRRMYIKAVLEIVDPDIVLSSVSSSGQAPWSKAAQLHDKETELTGGDATLELGRYLLDGKRRLIPNTPSQLEGQVGFVGNTLSGEDGTLSAWMEQPMSNVSVLQACSIYFSNDVADGWPVDLTVEVKSAGAVIYTAEINGNRERMVQVTGFTVYDPDAIRVTVHRWSLPRRRIRAAEIVAGLHEKWSEDTLASVDIQMRSNFSCLSIPYGTCHLRVENLDRRFDPRNKSGIFKSIEERQGIPVALGTLLESGQVEYHQVGIFYQYAGGWRRSDNGMVIDWDLVDIVGLLADREFLMPDTLPTTLAGWIGALAAQLGVNFADRWTVDPNYANVAVEVSDPGDVSGRKCGDVLRFACMASGTWPRADALTGNLTAEPFWNQGNKLDLDNLNSYPAMSANDDLAALIFKLYDGAGTIYVVSGNSTSSSKTLTIDNPFIHTAEQALTASRQILSQYGGIKLETVGRGDPISEIGDVDTVWLDASSATTGRRMEQSFRFSGGVLRDCKSVLLQADGSFMFENRQVFKASGTFHVPPGVTQVRLILSQGGQGGSLGEDGHVGGSGVLPGQGVSSNVGEKGLDGQGGKVWSGVVNVNPDTDYAVRIGAGGAASGVYGVPGSEGGESTFGVYSSANGQRYPYGFTDIASGDSYARTGVARPLAGSGDGGSGGEGGAAGSGYWEQLFWSDGRPRGWDFIVTKDPGPGKPGAAGGAGVCVISWDKEAETA